MFHLKYSSVAQRFLDLCQRIRILEIKVKWYASARPYCQRYVLL